MAEIVPTPPAAIRTARSTRVAGLRAAPLRSRGWWHQPALLNLFADLLLLFAAVALSWAAVVWLLAQPLLPVREIVIGSTPEQVSAEQLEYAARTAVQGNFFTIDLHAVKAGFEKLPWVRKVDVRRRWPDALELQIEEHRAVAYWTVSDSGELRLVNEYGEVFIAASEADMPHFSGPQGSSATLLAHYAEFERLLQPLEARLVDVDLSARAAWQLKLDNGLQIILGREQAEASLLARLQTFIQAWPRVREQVDIDIKVADLRYPGGFALTPVDGTVLQPAVGTGAGKGK
ncbi:MAG: cell division protein FtsQ/DivIB [Rhodocyclaceae bacterium]|nr:cell division protein FtsQ/DivIB [Rhodocyclaceae bacterium]